MTMRAMGAFSGTLPVPTGMLIGFLRDPKTFAYLQYAQMVPAPEIVFMYAKVDPDDAVRLVDLNEFGWGYDDYRPTGKSFQPRVEWTESRTQRWDFPYTVGEATLRVWRKNGIDPKMIYDTMRANHAALHRAARVVTALSSSLTGAQTASLNTLLGTAGAGLDKSSGTQYLPDGTPDPNFLVMKRLLNVLKRRVHLATNGAVGRDKLTAVLPPLVAEAWSRSGECFEALKQSQYAKELTDLADPSQDWNIPRRYAGFNLVVEDTPRVFINQKADGTVADVTVSSEKDYILNTDTIYAVSRPGALDGDYGGQNFSTVQVYHFNGEGRVEAFSEPKHELVEGHVVMEDRVLVPATASGFKVTDVLTT
jgi:hypothetical protein